MASDKHEHLLDKENMEIELNLIKFLSETSMFTISVIAARNGNNDVLLKMYVEKFKICDKQRQILLQRFPEV